MHRGTAAALMLLGFTITAHAQPATLTLACKGTTTFTADDPDAKKLEPISMGIIVDFSARTVQDFGFPGVLDYPVKITGANKVTVAFLGSLETRYSNYRTQGSINCVTGDVEAISMVYDSKTGNILAQTAYTLQCRPTQRMF